MLFLFLFFFIVLPGISSMAVPLQPDPHVSINAENDSGVSTSMNGSNSTQAGVPISSTSNSKESKSVNGEGD